MAGHGGKREGAGRKRGAATTKTRKIADEAASNGEMPLEYMLQVMRDTTADARRRDDMARAAAQYVHPRLSTMQHQGDAEHPLVHEIRRVLIDPTDGGDSNS